MKYIDKINAKVLMLPANGLLPIVKYYHKPHNDNETVPVILVAIYNVEQLATEIAKHLKGSTKHSCESDNDS